MVDPVWTTRPDTIRVDIVNTREGRANTFLGSIQRWRKKVVFVVNKADLLPAADDLRSVVDYVATHAAKACGVVVPVLPATSVVALSSPPMEGSSTAPVQLP